MESSERVTELLEAVSDNQKRLLEQQAKSLQLQREQVQLAQKLLDKPSEVNESTARFSKRGSAMMDKTRQVYLVIICLLVVLLFYVSWVLFA